MSIRLIDTTTLRMKVFVGYKVPKYAILSHTWVEGEETDFREFSTLVETGEPVWLKSGHDKILKTCQVAKDSGIEYVWIDTCCIDKSSSSELSEAINSMFNWYQNAQICYAYLSDLPPGCDPGATMKFCRWFTRGFTLQELLAPKTLHFYDREWNFVRSRINLDSTIQAITGIHKDVLNHRRPLSNVPTAVKMSWASYRSTTRVEDVAYCLMGIFQVNMPLLYGEGRNAFVRLQEEIIKRSNDLTIFCNFVSRPLSAVNEGKLSEMQRSPETSESETEAVPCPYHAADERKQLRRRNSHQPGRSRTLFAHSPRDFSRCGKLTATYALADGEIHNFALTNAGVHFKNATFQVVRFRHDLTRGCYAMSLKSHFQRADHAHCHEHPKLCMMLLEKLAPGLFVRRDISWHQYRNLNLYPTGGRMEVIEDAYVIPIDTYSDRLRDMDYCSMRLGLETGNDEADNTIGRALQVLAPKENWDAVNEAFLLMGEHFRGYVRLSPWYRRSGSKSKAHTPCCYLACRVDNLWSAEGPVMQVQLLQPKRLEQHSLELAMGESIESILENYPEHDCGTQDGLLLDGVVVSVTIEEIENDNDFGPICVKIQFKFDDEFKPQAEQSDQNPPSTAQHGSPRDTSSPYDMEIDS